MSLALCFNCGNVKFGALCECDKCGMTSTGNADLDILFSDWKYSADILEKFGSVVVQIQETTPDKNIAFWAFLKFISDNYPSILSINLDDEIDYEVKRVLDNLQIETFNIS